MRAAGEAGHADETDGLTFIHRIAHLNRQRSRIVEVRVDRRFAPAMLDDDHHAVGAPGVPRNGILGLDNPTGLTGDDGRKATDRVIYARVEALQPRAHAIGGADVPACRAVPIVRRLFRKLE